MTRHALKRPAAAVLIVGATALLGAAGPSAVAAGCVPPATAGPAVAGPVYGAGDATSGNGYVGAAGDQGYIEVSGSQAGNAAAFGSTSDGSAGGYIGVNGTSAMPSYCVTHP